MFVWLKEISMANMVCFLLENAIMVALPLKNCVRIGDVLFSYLK
jgi:hypothetical protein